MPKRLRLVFGSPFLYTGSFVQHAQTESDQRRSETSNPGRQTNRGGRGRTGRYADGHFTGTATHYENGEEFVIDQNSFRRFQPDPATGYFLNRLYFITTTSWLHGMSSDEMSRLQHRAATDVDFDLNDEAYLRRLWHWTRNLPTAFEGPDVFAVFNSKSKWRRNIFLVGA